MKKYDEKGRLENSSFRHGRLAVKRFLTQQDCFESFELDENGLNYELDSPRMIEKGGDVNNTNDPW